MNLLANAKASGIELTGSRTLVNITTDLVQNKNRITVPLSADIIEFVK